MFSLPESRTEPRTQVRKAYKTLQDSRKLEQDQKSTVLLSFQSAPGQNAGEKARKGTLAG